MPTCWASQRAELRAAFSERRRQRGRARRRAAPCHDLAQTSRVHPGEDLILRRVVRLSRRRVGEPAVAEAAGISRVPGRIADESDAQRRLAQGLAELCHDLRRSVVQPIEDAQQTRADVIARGPARGRRVSGKSEEVVALAERQMQPLCDRGEHLLRRAGPVAALETGVVVRRHVAEGGDLLAAQPRSPAALAPLQPDIRGLQRLSPHPQECGERVSIDHVSFAFPVTRCGLCSTGRGPRSQDLLLHPSPPVGGAAYAFAQVVLAVTD